MGSSCSLACCRLTQQAAGMGISHSLLCVSHRTSLSINRRMQTASQITDSTTIAPAKLTGCSSSTSRGAAENKANVWQPESERAMKLGFKSALDLAKAQNDKACHQSRRSITYFAVVCRDFVRSRFEIVVLYLWPPFFFWLLGSPPLCETLFLRPKCCCLQDSPRTAGAFPPTPLW